MLSPSHPPATLRAMPQTRSTRRAAVVLLAATAAVLAAAVGPPPVGPEAAAAQPAGEERPDGNIWTSGRASGKTSLWTHTNEWTCDALPCIDEDIGTASTAGETETTYCELRAATAGAVNPRGCGSHGNQGGWRWTRHVQPTGTEVDDSAEYECSALTEKVSSPAACGAWTECTGNTVPNSGGSRCVPCPSGQEPDDTGEDCEVPDCPGDQHRHGTAACGPDHDHGQTGPPCAADLTADETVRWTYHNSAGEDVSASKVCAADGSGGSGGTSQQACTAYSVVDGVKTCTGWVSVSRPDNRCARNSSFYPYGKVWGFSKAIYEAQGPTERRVRGHGGHWTTRTTYSSPSPLRAPHPDLWAPRLIPWPGPVDAPFNRVFWVEAWLGGQFSGADLPENWSRGGTWRPDSDDPTGRRFEPDGTIYRDVYDGQRCARVHIRHAGAGWRLINMAPPDPDGDGPLEAPATSGTGRGRRSFTSTDKTDQTAAAAFAAYEAWDVIVELDPNVGAPYPACGQRNDPSPARGDKLTGWRPRSTDPGGSAADRSCGWTVTIWRTVPISAYRPPAPGI